MKKIKTFIVLGHPERSAEAIKVGFSWAAFLLPLPWLLMHGLWGFSLVWVGGIVMSNFMHAAAGEVQGIQQTLLTATSAAAAFVLFLGPGLLGNRWRVDSLIAKGYKIRSTGEAESSKAAIIKSGG